MVSVVLVAVLNAAPVSVAIPGVNCAGLPTALCDSLLEHFVIGLSAQRSVKVMAAKDVTALIGLERQRQLMGCEGSSCVVELANALGVDGLVVMSVTRSSPYYLASARVLRTRDGSAWTQATRRVALEGQLFDAMQEMADTFVPDLVGLTIDRKPAASSWVRWIPAMAGGALAVSGVVVFLSAEREREALRTGGTPVADLVASGRLKEGLGLGLMAGGAVGLAVSLLWTLLASDTKAAAWLEPDGAALWRGVLAR